MSRERWLSAIACLVAVVAIARPFWAVTYPPLTDLPFHAAETSIFAHYGDPRYHFAEQFELHPLAVPYVSSYLLGAALTPLVGIVGAVKIASVACLLALPAGLAVLAWGSRRSPLIGLAGVPFAFGTLTHWGFLNFVAALGLFAACLGLGLRALDRPSRRTQIALGACLVLLLFTHVFRFPYALAALGLAAIALRRETGRTLPVILPALPALLLFAVFLWIRPRAVGGPLAVGLELGRLRELGALPVASFDDPWETRAAWLHLAVLAGVALASLRGASPAEAPRFARRARWITAGCVLAFLLSFLTLPMEIGVWWYVYPREATATLFLALGLLPELPAALPKRAACVAALALSALFSSQVVTDNYAAFERATADYRAIAARIPESPRLLYLVFEHGGSTRKNTPFIHLPAWTQAERGGWLSFHFAGWGTSPVRYRSDPAADVPPPVPRRWEWTPNVFRLKTHGAFFDTFLVRASFDPGGLFKSDPRIVEVAHEGTWWLYRREDDAAGRAGPYAP